MTKLEWLSAARDKLGLQEGQKMLLHISCLEAGREWTRANEELGAVSWEARLIPVLPKALRPRFSAYPVSTPWFGSVQDSCRAVMCPGIFVFSEFTYAI